MTYRVIFLSRKNSIMKEETGAQGVVQVFLLVEVLSNFSISLCLYAASFQEA